MNVQIPTIDLDLELVQGARRRTFSHIPVDVKVTVVTRADVFLDILMPGHPASQVSADIREYLHLFVAFP